RARGGGEGFQPRRAAGRFELACAVLQTAASRRAARSCVGLRGRKLASQPAQMVHLAAAGELHTPLDIPAKDVDRWLIGKRFDLLPPTQEVMPGIQCQRTAGRGLPLTPVLEQDPLFLEEQVERVLATGEGASAECAL